MVDPIKDAFTKVKEDIANLKQTLDTLHQEIDSIKHLIRSSKEGIDSQTISQTDNPAHIKTENESKPLIQQINPTLKGSFNDGPTDNSSLYGLKSPNMNVSSGNRGVPTNRQTNQQTNSQQTNTYFIDDNKEPNNLGEVSELLNSLDSLKKEVRFKFKRLTNQEMLVFSTIYQLEEEAIEEIDYPLISRRLTLSESSIRDYIQRIIKKGIPIIKTKVNNKKIILSISPDLKKIATLSTIIKLREV